VSKKKKAEPKLSKAERKALEQRAAELAAELARREKKAAKKKGKKAEPEQPAKKGKAAKLADDNAAALLDVAARAAERKAKSPKYETADAARKVLADENAAPAAKVAAETARDAAAEASDEETDEQIRARVLAKRAARAAAETGVTSTPEGLEAIIDPTPEKIEKAIEAVKAAKAAVQAVTEVQTEQGREFVAGVESITKFKAAAEPFALPSEAPRTDFEENGNHQYKVKRPSDGKTIGYTRATTYIANLEDTSALTKWKMRMLLEGVAINDTDGQAGRETLPDPVVSKVRDLIHTRDVALAKAHKADRKGKLVTGQLATIVDGAWSDFKRALNALAEELLELGGVHEKAQKGTDLHALCELYDREGIDAVGDLLTEGKITPADLADVEAYADAVRRAGIKFDLIEQTVVNDELKVGGRLDRTALVKLPGMARSTRVVADIKTGRIDLGAGKIAQQLEMYASSQAYDLDTDERIDMKLSRTKAILIHLPAGTATCTVHVVDLVLGRKGNALSGQVRAWRNEGKKAIDTSVDLAAPEGV
jgi:chemotaxis protein histidine kinase CheA